MLRDINYNISKSDTDVTSVNSRLCGYNIKPLNTLACSEEAWTNTINVCVYACK